MRHEPGILARTALMISTASLLAMASPAHAGSGKGGHGHYRAAHHCPGSGGTMADRRLTVIGEGEARVAPDMATVQLGVTSQADSAAEAMRQNSTRQSAVIEALKGAGIDERNIQTSGLSLGTVMDYGENRAPRVTGYQASNMVAVRVTEIADLGAVLDAIVDAGANEINGIDFGRDDGTDVEDEARRAAVADARHKAGVLAEAAGLTLGPVLMLRDNQVSGGPRPMMRMAADGAAASESVPVQAGELSMSASVQMEYALIGGMESCRQGMEGRHHRGGMKQGKAAPTEMPPADGAALPEAQAPAPGEGDQMPPPPVEGEAMEPAP
ncbi:SIMPL domain-containing protein [Paracoccus salsus]|uniref:SIMPL domain-containing protein n=1 Tax=Paracoccus salsus TaxID=2911061 RepID=UPI001F32C6F4|nr:SIMPL domain-containing protein [Paracoccus salsus]MCF3974067.1 SIMPL domain-containing protein [Paracoccus salsus]